VLLIVGGIVIAHAALLFSDEPALEFEAATAVFFAVEVALRIYAHTIYYFFMGYSGTCLEFDRWLNTLDFVLSLIDVMSIGVHFALPAEDVDTHEAARVGSHAVDIFGKAASKSTHLINKIPRFASRSGRLSKIVLRFVRFVRMGRLVRVFRSSACSLQNEKLKPGPTRSWAVKMFDYFDCFDAVGMAVSPLV
jgi:hypothetical protein